MKILNIIITLFLILQTGNISAQENGAFKNPNPKETIKKLSADTILFKHQYEPLVQELYQLRKDVEEMKKEISSKDNEIALLQELGVDNFLNIQDITIFESNFLEAPVDEITPRSKDFYLLIKDIHDLNQLLAEMENMNIAQLSNVGNKLTVARSLVDEINSYASIEKRKITDFLSEEQKQYFRNLVNRFNTLNALINPQ